MDFDVSIWDIDNMDTRNPIPGSGWLVSNEKRQFLKKIVLFSFSEAPPRGSRGAIKHVFR